jgi:hypothetical protein
MKHTNKLLVQITAVIVIGFLFAGAGTEITYTCGANPGDAGCISFDKAVMHPRDLLRNKQGSLVQFSKTFTIGALVTFAIFNVYSWTKTKKES